MKRLEERNEKKESIRLAQEAKKAEKKAAIQAKL